VTYNKDIFPIKLVKHLTGIIQTMCVLY